MREGRGPLAERPRVIVICGPTASGKTSLSVELACAFSGEIVNADAMQVYRGMDIGTARPGFQEQGGVPHHLFGVVNPDEEFHAALYRTMALEVLNDIHSRGKICFVVGGTGLYIRALVGGLMQAPPSDPGLRARLRSDWEEKGPVALHERLRELDGETAQRIHPHDRTRVIRALEIILLTRRSPLDFAKDHGFREQAFRSLMLGIQLDRGELYRRIDARSEAMAAGGLIQETRGLLEKGYSPDLKSMKAIGYRHMVRYLAGEWSLEEAVDALKRDTRRYAKRQLTWFRAEPSLIWLAPPFFPQARDHIRSFLKEP